MSLGRFSRLTQLRESLLRTCFKMNGSTELAFFDSLFYVIIRKLII